MRFAPILLLLATPALAQEAMYTQAATMPGPAGVIYRTQVHVARYGTEPTTNVARATELELINAVQIGLVRDLSLTLEAPVVFKRETLNDGSRDSDSGVEDLDAMLKYRIYREDGKGVNTTRIALLGGAQFASGDDGDFSSKSVNPHLGGVISIIRGRHGFSQDASFKLNTRGDDAGNRGGDGPSNVFMLNSSYVFRLFPDAFTSESIGAWYTTTELSCYFETNGDSELRYSVGIMYEGRRWAFEAMVQLPLWNELDHRAELDWACGVGFRFSF
jgi:hypothetical protein